MSDIASAIGVSVASLAVGLAVGSGLAEHRKPAPQPAPDRKAFEDRFALEWKLLDRAVKDATRDRDEYYFEFRACQMIMQQLGVNVAVYQSNGVTPWMEFSHTVAGGTNKLSIKVPDFTKK